MSMQTQFNSTDFQFNHTDQNNVFLANGLNRLENYLPYHDFIYVLHKLYKIVLASAKKKEDKITLKTRIRRFEEQSNLPGFLSIMPIEQILAELEDAQYRFPLRKREINFPTFH